MKVKKEDDLANELKKEFAQILEDYKKGKLKT